MVIEQWVPTIVSTSALGLVFWAIRDQMKKVETIEKDYLEINVHEKLEEIQYLKLEKVIADEVKKLNDTIFPELRAIKDRLPTNVQDKK